MICRDDKLIDLVFHFKEGINSPREQMINIELIITTILHPQRGQKSNEDSQTFKLIFLPIHVDIKIILETNL